MRPQIFNKILILLIFLCPSLAMAAKELEPLRIRTQQGVVEYRIEHALTREQQERGLMHRTSLPERHGMLFSWKQDQPITMWMKNTPLSLDMLFISAQGVIITIAANTTPNSTDIISSGVPVRAVLELEGGSAERDGIRVGDVVLHRVFKP